MNHLPILSLLLLSLPLGAALIWLAPSPRWSGPIALAASLVNLAIGLLVLALLDPAEPGFQLVEHQPWIPTLNIHYSLGVDGISAAFLPLGALLLACVIGSEVRGVHQMQRLHFTLLLLLGTTTQGVFLALDTMLFFVFWELGLIPVYFLVSLWGIGPNRRYAATKYTMLMLIGGVALLFAFLVLAFAHAQATSAGAIPAGLGFDYPGLLSTPLPARTELLVFVLLLIGFGVKTPLVPFHTWLPLMAAEGPVALTTLVAGLKIGAYGLIRFLVPLAPQVSQELYWVLAGLGAVGIIYGALGAMAQTNLRRMLAFASVSHVGLVVLGIAAMNEAALKGAIFQLMNFTVVTGGLFLITGFIHRRTGTTELSGLGGLASRMPVLTGIFLLLALASIGLPGTNGFPADLLLIVGALDARTGTGLAALAGVVLSAAYLLPQYRRAFLGPVTRAAVAQCVDLRPRELAVALVLAAAVVLPGLYPQGIIDLIRASGDAWLAHSVQCRTQCVPAPRGADGTGGPAGGWRRPTDTCPPLVAVSCAP